MDARKAASLIKGCPTLLSKLKTGKTVVSRRQYGFHCSTDFLSVVELDLIQELSCHDFAYIDGHVAGLTSKAEEALMDFFGLAACGLV